MTKLTKRERIWDLIESLADENFDAGYKFGVLDTKLKAKEKEESKRCPKS